MVLRELIEVSIILILIIGCSLVIGSLLESLYKDYKEVKAYKEFCATRPSFCFCSTWECQFKTSWNSLEGLSQDTKELCVLANSLKDKETMFKAGCDQ